MTYIEKINIMIIDRLLVGAIIGIAIYFGSIQLEKVKFAEGFSHELNKQRIEKIAEIDEKALEYERAQDDLFDTINSEKFSLMLKGEKKSKDEIYQIAEIKHALDVHDKAWKMLYRTIDQNKFYLDPALEYQMRELIRSFAILKMNQEIPLDDYVPESYDPTSIDDARKRVELFRPHISQIRDHMITGKLIIR